MKKLSKSIPKEFFEFLDKHKNPQAWTESEIEKCKEILSTCDPNASSRTVYQKYLLLTPVPLEIIKWLLERGADVNAKSTYYTPLIKHTYDNDYEICKFLIDKGADVNAEVFDGTTALFYAADHAAVEVVKLLLESGADSSHHSSNIYSLDDGQTPLLYVLSRQNLVRTGDVAELLVNDQRKHGGIPENEWKKAQEYVLNIGHKYEWRKSSKNDEQELEELKDKPELYKWALKTAAEEKDSIEKLYALFEVEPVKPIIKHDGKSPITLDEKLSPEEQFSALWDYLVPTSGSCETVQGELIRICGRLVDEILGNGGVNWDSQYKKMINATVKYLKKGTSLNEEDLQAAKDICDEIIEDEGYNCDGLDELRDLILQWVSKNPQPILLEKVGYRR